MGARRQHLRVGTVRCTKRRSQPGIPEQKQRRGPDNVTEGMLFAAGTCVPHGLHVSPMYVTDLSPARSLYP